MIDQNAIFSFKYPTNHCVSDRKKVGAYAGAERRRVHLATVLLQPPTSHCPDRRQVRHAHILQIGLHLTQTLSTRAASRHGSATRTPQKKSDERGPL